MKNSKWLKFSALIISLILVFAVTAHADFGEFAGDYDYGGDYGGGFDYDSGNDYDYDYGGNDYDYGNDDYNNNYGGGVVIYDSDSNGNSGSGGGGGTILIIIILVVLIFGIPILRAMKKGKGKSGPVAPGATPTDVSTLRPVNEYTSVDPNFSQPDFCEEISNMYVRFQNAWQDKKLDGIRPCLSDAFYAQVDRQVETYRRNKQTNRIERISVLGVDLVGWKQESGNDVMIARLRTRIVDYVVDDATGNIVRGSNTAEKFMTYEWSLIRTSGRTTGGNEGTNASSCPNCGAPLDLNKSAKCEYCGSVIESDSFDWVLSGIKGLSQRTAGN